MKKIYHRLAWLIEKLQKFRADNDIEQHPDSYKALHAMRQTSDKDVEGEPK